MQLLPLLLLPLAALTSAQSPTTSPSEQQQQQQVVTVVTGPNLPAGYAYHGCYNETTEPADTSGVRALAGGANLVRPGGMTVETCLDFCKTGAGDASGGKSGRFKFAGLEYASLSEKFPDTACNLPCEGNTTQACGGNLKLTVYMAGAATARVALAASLAAVGALTLTLL
ncbi:hypothetical protein NEMBOFW57_002602 [Staphylotrichum longicolle]|uniref:WSC domain-containing protein n=1 Tax=Staphylotrichum longicolle TaxID=669026 RepID=A0AAD4F6E1_9PEZI|nr:hypothetical protein NEMBOFW57_002602 [Staphylotrichum longicolle]